MRNKWNHTPPAHVQRCPADNTSSYIGTQVDRYHTDSRRLIHPETAMEIAAWWHGPNHPGLTAFSSTGTVTDDLLPEIDRELTGATGDDRRDLEALTAYVRNIPTTTES